MIFHFEGLHVPINDPGLSDGLFISAVSTEVVKQHLQLVLRVTLFGRFGVWDVASNYSLEPEISEIQVRHTKHGENLGQ